MRGQREILTVIPYFRAQISTLFHSILHFNFDTLRFYALQAATNLNLAPNSPVRFTAIVEFTTARMNAQVLFMNAQVSLYGDELKALYEDNEKEGKYGEYASTNK